TRRAPSFAATRPAGVVRGTRAQVHPWKRAASQASAGPETKQIAGPGAGLRRSAKARYTSETCQNIAWNPSLRLRRCILTVRGPAAKFHLRAESGNGCALPVPPLSPSVIPPSPAVIPPALSESKGPERPDFLFCAEFWRVGPRSGGTSPPACPGHTIPIREGTVGDRVTPSPRVFL